LNKNLEHRKVKTTNNKEINIKTKLRNCINMNNAKPIKTKENTLNKIENSISFGDLAFL
jgi:hypothetical protein